METLGFPSRHPHTPSQLTVAGFATPVQLVTRYSRPLHQQVFPEHNGIVHYNPLSDSLHASVGTTPMPIVGDQVDNTTSIFICPPDIARPPSVDIPVPAVSGSIIPSHILSEAVPVPSNAGLECSESFSTLPIVKLGLGAWQCLVCQTKLRRRQRAIAHYLSKHGGVRLFCKGQCGIENW